MSTCQAFNICNFFFHLFFFFFYTACSHTVTVNNRKLSACLIAKTPKSSKVTFPKTDVPKILCPAGQGQSLLSNRPPCPRRTKQSEGGAESRPSCLGPPTMGRQRCCCCCCCCQSSYRRLHTSWYRRRQCSSSAPPKKKPRRRGKRWLRVFNSP